MISLNWIMVLPANLSAEKFDKWYLEGHTLYGKASDGIIRYTVNRVVTDQPGTATGDIWRVAQEYWADWDSFEKCWNSPSGHAVLGDGLVNIGLDPGTIPAIGLTNDEQLPVANPAQFSTVARGYRGTTDGTIAKFLAYGFAKDKAGFNDWYKESFSGLGEDPSVREHVLGETVGKTLEIGYLSTLPGEGQKGYDWLVELWFDDADTAREYLNGDAFKDAWAKIAEASTETVSAVFRGQEMLVNVEPVHHKDW